MTGIGNIKIAKAYLCLFWYFHSQTSLAIANIATKRALIHKIIL